MRHVYPTNEIPHKWAHQTQEKARNPQGNLFFRGQTIYSYRESWPLARIYTRGKKRPWGELVNYSPQDVLVLTNSEKYSNTTAKHQHTVNCACRHLLSIAVPYVVPQYAVKTLEKRDHDRNVKHFEDKMTRLRAEASRAMSENAVQLRAERIAAVHKAMADYLIFFKIRRKMPPMPELASLFERARRIENPDPASLDKRERASARRRELKAEKDARKNERRNLIEIPCARTNWRLFGAFNASGGNYYRVPGPTMLRVVDEEIVTSMGAMGARVPVATAPMVWNLVQRARDNGGLEPTRALGRLKIGDYSLDRIDADGTLHAGCHTIPFSEIATMARRLGLQ